MFCSRLLTTSSWIFLPYLRWYSPLSFMLSPSEESSIIFTSSNSMGPSCFLSITILSFFYFFFLCLSFYFLSSAIFWPWIYLGFYQTSLSSLSSKLDSRLLEICSSCSFGMFAFKTLGLSCSYFWRIFAFLSCSTCLSSYST